MRVSFLAVLLIAACPGASVRLPSKPVDFLERLGEQHRSFQKSLGERFKWPPAWKGRRGSAHKAAKDEEYGGNPALRMLNFWGRALDIYGDYKVSQTRIAVRSSLIRDPEERERRFEEWWDEVHERNSDKMLKLCLDLRGFYLKAGQFLGSRPDFMPTPYIIKLSTLHDRVPPIPAAHVKKVIEEELGGVAIDEVFSSLNLLRPVGAASICQVHEGRLRATKEKVAVKVQYPGAEAVMKADLANLRTLCSYLKKFELKFDLVSMITELQKQISQEFDFTQEAVAQSAIGPALQRAVPSVSVPKPYMATRRLLVMSFLEGTQITRLGELGYSNGAANLVGRKRLATGLLNRMAEAWGFMLFQTELFHADPHPGNILVMPGLRLGILDWGQTKKLDPQIRSGLARLFVAMGRNNQTEIVDEFYRLGVQTANRDNPQDIVRMVFSMFDTCHVEDYCSNPFAKEHGLNQNAVLSFPSELCYVLRSVQIMRGMAKGMGVDYSLTQKWAPLAKELLDQEDREGLLLPKGGPAAHRKLTATTSNANDSKRARASKRNSSSSLL